jgi:hypothetical protein
MPGSASDYLLLRSLRAVIPAALLQALPELPVDDFNIAGLLLRVTYQFSGQRLMRAHFLLPAFRH